MRTLFDYAQPDNLARCRSKLAEAILAFCRGRLADGAPDFHADDLLRWCNACVPGLAPDSPSRILRLLRREGRVMYMVVNRRDSHYRLC